MQKNSVGGGLFGAIKGYFNPIQDSRPAPASSAAPPAPAVATATPPAAPMHGPYRRFLSDNPVLYEQAIDAAESYVSRMPPSGLGWLRTKPFDPAPGSAQYFRLMYDLLNILQAMQLPPNAHILEVGSGPGWITEILLMLGHEVDALEPSADMIAVARERCTGLQPHFGLDAAGRVRFHKNTIEEIEFAADTFDAVLYFDVLHHVVDEHAAIEKTFRWLKPAGCMGVVEAAWHPDFKELEASLIREMKEFGTLENPFSTEYLDSLLGDAGFVGTKRYAGVNGLFGAEQLQQPLAHFGAPLYGVNNVVARKPGLPSCDNISFRTAVRYALREGGLDALARKAAVTVAITNCGETLLDNRVAAKTHVTLALRRGVVGSREFIEAKERHLLATALSPGETVTMTMLFTLPDDAPVDGWELDAIAEGLYWFSSRGIAALAVPTLAA